VHSIEVLTISLYSGKSDDGSHDVGFGALFELFSVMLENSGNPYDPLNPREWVR